MASSRHKHTLERSFPQRFLRLALPAIGVIALVSGSLAVALNSPSGPGSADATTRIAASANTSQLLNQTSRSDVRPPLPDAALASISGFRYAKVALDLHAGPTASSPVLLVIRAGNKVDITGVNRGTFAEVVYDGASRWVKAQYLISALPAKRPSATPAQTGLSSAPCAGGSAVEAGIQPDTIRVHRAVCAQFPEIARYIGLGGGGEHATGRAIDIMLDGSGNGDAIAAFAIKYARQLGVSQVIYRQRIWTVERAAEGWRPMPDRGSPTANHMDHVHVSTYGNSGTA